MWRGPLSLQLCLLCLLTFLQRLQLDQPMRQVRRIRMKSYCNLTPSTHRTTFKQAAPRSSATASRLMTVEVGALSLSSGKQVIRCPFPTSCNRPKCGVSSLDRDIESEILWAGVATHQSHTQELPHRRLHPLKPQKLLRQRARPSVWC